MPDTTTPIQSDSDAHNAHFERVLTSGRVGVWELDPETGEAWRNARHDAIFGYPEMLSAWTYDLFLSHVLEEDREQVDALYSRALATRQDWAFECRIRRADGAVRWIAAEGQHFTGSDVTGTRLVGHVMDITERKENEERLRLISNELNHRLRNVVGMIQGLVNLTGRNVDTVKDFQKALQGRLDTLARAYQLTPDTHSQSVPLDALLDRFASFGGLRERIEIVGAEGLPVSGKASEMLSLALHELTTNAIKYGALSNEDGRVRLSVTKLETGLQLVWQEIGGPPVSEPKTKGFGSQLLGTAFRGSQGEAVLRFPPEGVVCTLTLANNGEND
ncbi:sensor histidine kinase [Maricaulis sp. CAU 1757]